jgi:hypothetical protein
MYEGFYAVLEIFFVEPGLLGHLNIGSCTTSWVNLRTQERGNADVDPNANHKREVLHSPLNEWRSGETQQNTTPGGHRDVAGYVLQ